MAPYRHALQLRPGLVGGAPNFNRRWSEFEPGSTDVVDDDVILVYLQGSTQWDSLCHVGSLFDADGDGEPEIVYYNGFRGGEHIDASTDPADCGMWSTATTRVRALSIDKTVEEGDMLCLHTGFAQLLLDAGDEPDARGLMMSTPALDGRDPLLQAWIRDSGVATISADNIAVEARPATPATTPCAALPLHELCLFRLGVHLGEMWQLGPLAEWLRANGRSRFLLTAPPLRVPGAVGSPANGLATV